MIRRRCRARRSRAPGSGIFFHGGTVFRCCHAKTQAESELAQKPIILIGEQPISQILKGVQGATFSCPFGLCLPAR